MGEGEVLVLKKQNTGNTEDFYVNITNNFTFLKEEALDIEEWTRQSVTKAMILYIVN